MKAASASTLASVAATQADTNKAKDDLQRSEALRTGGAISTQDLVHAKATFETSAATLDSKKKQADAAAAYMSEAQAQVESAKAQVAGSKAEVAQAKAALDLSQLSVSYTRIIAPESGRVTNKSVEPGAYVQVGQALLALVPEEVWVTANFKETQLDKMRPASLRRSRSTPIPAGRTGATSIACRPAPARGSASCRRKMPRGIS